MNRPKVKDYIEFPGLEEVRRLLARIAMTLPDWKMIVALLERDHPETAKGGSWYRMVHVEGQTGEIIFLFPFSVTELASIHVHGEMPPEDIEGFCTHAAVGILSCRLWQGIMLVTPEGELRLIHVLNPPADPPAEMETLEGVSFDPRRN